MSLTYGFLKDAVSSKPVLKATRRNHETQYHLHVPVTIERPGAQTQEWDTAINVGTDDSDDLLNYKIVFDFHHPLRTGLQDADAGFADLTGTRTLPALDFLRSDVLKETGDWRPSDPIDGSDQVEPVASLMRLFQRARMNEFKIYVFGRKYTDGLGVHDVHMNQGSSAPFFYDGENDDNDHNDVWQDGAVFVELDRGEFAAYVTAFTQQLVPTDELGNPKHDGHRTSVADDGSLA